MSEKIITPKSPFAEFRMSIMPKDDGGFRSSEIRIGYAESWIAAGLKTRSGDILDFFEVAGAEFAEKTGFPLPMVRLVQFNDEMALEHVLYLETVGRHESPVAFALRDALKPAADQAKRSAERSETAADSIDI